MYHSLALNVKNMLTKIRIEVCYFLIQILRKLKVSVIIGFKVENATIRPNQSISFYYDNTLNECITLTSDEQPIDIPNNQPFKIYTEPLVKERSLNEF